DVTALQTELPDLKIVDATRLVALVAAVKTQRELETMRQSMALTDVAVQTVQRSLREGVTELEGSHAGDSAITAAGRDTPPYPPPVGRASPPTARPSGRTSAAQGRPRLHRAGGRPERIRGRAL